MIAPFLAVAFAAATITSPSSNAWVCSTLDRNPNESGVWQVLLQGLDRGLVGESGGQEIVDTIQSQCPEYIPLLITWAEHND
jgi:hypothetical protein